MVRRNIDVTDQERGPGILKLALAKTRDTAEAITNWPRNAINGIVGGTRNAIGDTFLDTKDTIRESAKEAGTGILQLLNRGVVVGFGEFLKLRPGRAAGQVIHSMVSAYEHIAEGAQHVIAFPLTVSVNAVKGTGRAIGGILGQDLTSENFNPLQLQSTASTWEGRSFHKPNAVINRPTYNDYIGKAKKAA